MKKYIGIFITTGSTPPCSYRVSTSKAWCTRHVNHEYYRAECVKDFTRKYNIVVDIENLHLSAVMREHDDRFMIYVKNVLMDILNMLEAEERAHGDVKCRKCKYYR